MKGNEQPLLVVIAGPNGSGKSTITKELAQEPDFPDIYINADEIKINEGLSDTEAWEEAEWRRTGALSNRESFAFETVFSHSSKIDLMKEAKEAGYWVRLYFVCLQDAEMNVQRVQKRHQSGGHDVPKDKIRSRYLRSMQMLSHALPVVDEAAVYNNSWESPALIARKTHDGKVQVYPLVEDNPESNWTKQEIEKLLGI